jgi:DNA (cytosine-5)-methyltransferase 1
MKYIYRNVIMQSLGIDSVNEIRDYKMNLFNESSDALANLGSVHSAGDSENFIQIVDFFSGAGGTSLGFAAVNVVVPVFKFLGGCDINKESATSYSENFHTPLLNEDILDIAKDRESIEKFFEKIGYQKDKPLFLIGCAPCQGFTSHRKRYWNEEDDDRNDLVVAFSKIVETMQPDAFLMENVPEFLSGKYQQYFFRAKNIFENSGYIVKQNIYNSAGFGVPQERFRAIVIGMKKDFLLPKEVFNFGEYKTVRDTIENLKPLKSGEKDPEDYMHKSVAHKKSTIEIIKQVPKDGGSRPEGVGPQWFADVYGRLSWDKPSITITHYARNPASGRFVHPEQNRGLTAREVALLQSFPLNFKFAGKSDDIYRQIGEAVPPLFSCAIATDILLEFIADPPTEEQLKNSNPSIETPVSNSFSSVISGIKQSRRQKRCSTVV